MKFTLNWLKEHLETQASLEDIVETLTRIGLEVEGVDNPGEKLAAFKVAKVLTAERHPQADKLQVLTVDTGDGNALQVVCGAPNARAGLVGVLGLPGAIVPANGMELRVSAIRGVESNGMMCSTRELELGDDHEGIIELPADAPVGTTFPDYAGLNDPVIDVSITPNRQDCMGVRGIARDLAAAGLGTLKPLADVYRYPTPVRAEPVEARSSSRPSTSSGRTEVPEAVGEGPGPDVRTDDMAGCPAFYGQEVRGVTNGAAPEWMRRFLTAIGQKPISVLVDITNFVSVDLGRPLHVYDKAKLSGGLVARRARAGEQVLALNGKTYTLDETMTVIADDTGVHDIGGIMGGEHSGVSGATTDVIIECAYFDPDHIARTGQKLGLTSDARQRFERGVDPAFLDDGLAIATKLVIDHCGGTPSGITRAGAPPVAPRIVQYDPARAETLGGLAVAPERQKDILERLGFTVGSDWQVTVPSWRRDVDGSADGVPTSPDALSTDALTSAASAGTPVSASTAPTIPANPTAATVVATFVAPEATAATFDNGDDPSPGSADRIDAGPATTLSRPRPTARKARTTSGSNCWPEHRASSSRAADAVSAFL